MPGGQYKDSENSRHSVHKSQKSKRPFPEIPETAFYNSGCKRKYPPLDATSYNIVIVRSVLVCDEVCTVGKELQPIYTQLIILQHIMDLLGDFPERRDTFLVTYDKTVVGHIGRQDLTVLLGPFLNRLAKIRRRKNPFVRYQDPVPIVVEAYR